MASGDSVSQKLLFLEGKVVVKLRPRPTYKKRPNKTKGTNYDLKSVGICAFLARIFEDNEKLPAAKRLDDEKIRFMLAKEYGHLETVRKMQIWSGQTRAARHVGYYRNLYNLGELLKEHHHQPPKLLSHRYAECGTMANRRTGRPLDAEGTKQERQWEKEFRERRAKIVKKKRKPKPKVQNNG